MMLRIGQPRGESEIIRATVGHRWPLPRLTRSQTRVSAGPAELVCKTNPGQDSTLWRKTQEGIHHGIYPFICPDLFPSQARRP